MNALVAVLLPAFRGLRVSKFIAMAGCLVSILYHPIKLRLLLISMRKNAQSFVEIVLLIPAATDFAV